VGGHVTRLGEVRNSYKIVVGGTESRTPGTKFEISHNR
jgi:hypothetical protein